MKKYLFFLVTLLVLPFIQVTAQNHFIYIQSETIKPFTVSIGDKKFKSSLSGYVIIPRLKNGQHEITVDYQEDKTFQSKFIAVIDRKDLGYNLKDVNSSTIALVDIQNSAVLNSIPADLYAKNENTSIPNDKAIKNVGVSNAANEKSIEKKDAKIPVKNTTGELSLTTAIKLKKGINKISEVNNENSISLTFIDVIGNTSDTIDVFIPISNNENNSAYNSHAQDNYLFQWASAKTANLYMLDDFQTGYNTKCVHLLTKEDLARLRRKMSAESSEDKMVQEAIKYSISKCFTTDDVKKLSNLFVKDQGKLKLFQAIYRNVYDYSEYAELEKELKEHASIIKFRASLNK